MFCASNDQTHTRSITTRMNTVVARKGGQEAASATSNNSVLSRSLQLPGQLRGSVLAGGLTAFAYVRAAKQSDSSHAARQEIAPVFSAFLSPQRRAHTGRRQMTAMTCMRYALGNDVGVTWAACLAPPRCGRRGLPRSTAHSLDQPGHSPGCYYPRTGGI